MTFSRLFLSTSSLCQCWKELLLDFYLIEELTSGSSVQNTGAGVNDGVNMTVHGLSDRLAPTGGRP